MAEPLHEVEREAALGALEIERDRLEIEPQIEVGAGGALAAGGAPRRRSAPAAVR